MKTHHVRYLPDAPTRWSARLAPVSARRCSASTPGRSAGTSWYLRLPGPAGEPWAGVVRCEANGTLGDGRRAALADVVAAPLLPRFASVPHKDPRAPQNLSPIGALERLLRHRLGDAQVWYRALRVASSPHSFPLLTTLGRPSPTDLLPTFARRDKSGRMTDGLRSKGPPCLIRPLLPRSPKQPVTCSTSRKNAIEGVKDWAGDVADQAHEKVSPTKKKRSKLPLLLVVLGLGAVVFFVLRRRGGDSYDSVAPDAFGAAVEADVANNGGRAPHRQRTPEHPRALDR